MPLLKDFLTLSAQLHGKTTTVENTQNKIYINKIKTFVQYNMNSSCNASIIRLLCNLAMLKNLPQFMPVFNDQMSTVFTQNDLFYMSIVYCANLV